MFFRFYRSLVKFIMQKTIQRTGTLSRNLCTSKFLTNYKQITKKRDFPLFFGRNCSPLYLELGNFNNAVSVDVVRSRLESFAKMLALHLKCKALFVDRQSKKYIFENYIVQWQCFFYLRETIAKK